MQILLSNSLKKLALVTVMLFGISFEASALSCDNRAFNIKVSARVSSYDILNQLSGECGFSMLSLDMVANKKLNEKLYGINIQKMKLHEIFNLLILSKGLQYKYDKSVLKISGLITRTFKVDYVNSERSGSSNTDISMNGDTDTGKSAGSNNSQTTGAKIKSSDSFKFWSSIQDELTAILNSPIDRGVKSPKPIINKEAGLVTVTGTALQIRRVSSYLDDMMRRLHKQVTIDVKIYRVSLDNSRATGIDWSQIYQFQNIKANYESLKNSGVSKIDDNHISELGSASNGYGKFIRLSGEVSINNLIHFLDSQGDVTSISNPKVTTLNNQPAIFSSGEQLYYKIQQTVTNSTATGAAVGGTSDVIKSVFAGVLLDITPEITDENEIILKINPSISSVSNDATLKDVKRDMPPDIKKQQMSAVVKLKDGERIVLGGLITTSKGTQTKKVPVLGNIPVLGGAFARKVRTDKKEELVIIITPHIVSPYKKVSLKTLGYDGID